MSNMDILGPTVKAIVQGKMETELRSSQNLYDSLKAGHKTGVKVIPEIKPSSPSLGVNRLIDETTIPEIVKQMEAGGASAISVLVEQRKFQGSMEILKTARKATDLPLIAKGFHFQPFHLAECAAAGADAYLHMVRLIDSVDMDNAQFAGLAMALGLEPLIEANDEYEVLRASKIFPSGILAVNNRRIYDDMKIDLARAEMGAGLPEDVVFVSASGVEDPDDMETVFEASQGRVDAVLVGTSVMRSNDIEKHVSQLAEKGRELVK